MENLIHIQITALFGVIYIGGSSGEASRNITRGPRLKKNKIFLKSKY
jgi:hypothetical protein